MRFFFQAEDGIRDLVRSRGLGDVYKRQHVMLTMREVGKDGFRAKVREWNKAELVEQWRERLSLIHI